MIETLLEQSKEIQRLIDLGFALVPSNVWNKDGKPKVPWHRWKKIEKKLNAVELIDALYESKGDSVAVLSGKISGFGFDIDGNFNNYDNGLFIIDIDTKYKEGIDSKIFNDLKDLYKDVFEKLRIERTPSGGYHIYYRIQLDEGREFPGYVGVLAGRAATEEELEKKPSTTKYGFIEIKNVCQCFPSEGYKVIKEGIGNDGFVNLLSWSEHISIFNLLKEYDERLEKNFNYIKPLKNDLDYYDESPWISFNKGNESDCVLDKYGDWRRRSDKENSNRVYFIKPGKPASYKEDGAVYRKDKGFYSIYTTSGGVDDGNYSPVSLLLNIKFKGDKKACFEWLKSEGYGKLKDFKEKSIIKKAISLGKGVDFLPKNISEKAKEEFLEEVKNINADYCYGIFWEEYGEEGYRISREDIVNISGKIGFRINGNDVCYVSGHIVEVVNDRFYFDKLKNYLGNCQKEIKNCFEAFVQNNGKFTITRLPILDTNLILESTKEVSYKAYNNGYVRITKNGYSLVGYEGLDKLIWKHMIQDRNYVECSEDESRNGLYWKFLDKAIIGGVSNYLLKLIGYYSHDYKSTRTPYIAVLCETCDNPDNGGGSGKNVFTNLLRFTSSVLNKPAKGIKFDDTMLRTRKQERILSINDAEKDFDYLALREFSSGEGEVGKKYEQERTISNKDMPKPIVNTNYAFNPFAPGLKRRLIPAEFTSFFIDCGGVDVYFGVDFPSENNDTDHGWDEKEFIYYDYIVLHSIMEFLNAGCKLKPNELTDGGWIKQFEQEFSKSTFDFINEFIKEWIELGIVSIKNKFNKDYTGFCFENNIQQKWQLSSIKMNKALSRYCDHNGIKFVPCKNERDLNGIQDNVKIFKRIDGFVKVVSIDIENNSSNSEFDEEFDSELKNEDLPF